MTDPFAQAKALFLDGLACFEAARFEDAEQRFQASLAQVPGRVSTLINLAATRLKLSRMHDALRVADQVLALEPDNLDAWYHRATALARLGRTEEALVGFDRVLANDSTLAQAWSDRGGVLREMNRFEEAAQAYRQAIAHGADAELNGYFLTRVPVWNFDVDAGKKKLAIVKGNVARFCDSLRGEVLAGARRTGDECGEIAHAGVQRSTIAPHVVCENGLPNCGSQPGRR